MESCLRYSLVILLAGVCTMAFGAQPADKPFPAGGASPSTALGTGEATDANLPAMPFMAEITSDDVYVRSGAGTNYYYCSKLKNGDKIKVVSSKFSWLQIVAPAGSYAWISSQYIQVNPQDKTIGTVIGDAVRVYAGSDDVQPMHSTSSLTKLNKGDKVTLLGEEKEGYSKITPPEGAYLWVSNQYVRPLGSLVPPSQPTPSLTPGTPPSPAAPFPAPTPGVKPQAASPNEPPSVSTSTAPVEDPRIKQLDELKKSVDAEKAKPIHDQNFGEIKKTLGVMAADKQSTRIARSAQNLLKTVERYELAQEVVKTAKLQDEQFGQTTEKIEKAKAAKLAEVEDFGIFAVIGQLKESTLSTGSAVPKLYRIVNSDGKTVCYAQPSLAEAQEDLSRYIDKKVGLIGTIETRPSLGDAVVVFTKAIPLE